MAVYNRPCVKSRTFCINPSLLQESFGVSQNHTNYFYSPIFSTVAPTLQWCMSQCQKSSLTFLQPPHRNLSKPDKVGWLQHEDQILKIWTNLWAILKANLLYFFQDKVQWLIFFFGANQSKLDSYWKTSLGGRSSASDCPWSCWKKNSLDYDFKTTRFKSYLSCCSQWRRISKLVRPF